VKKFDGTNWTNIGTNGFASVDSAAGVQIAMLSGTPYVAFTDFANGRKISVRKFDGTNWVNVGTAGFSTGIGSSPSIAFDNSGVPYVSFTDAGVQNRIVVRKLAGTTWIVNGTASVGNADNGVLLNNSGNMIVSFRDAAQGNVVRVKTFYENSWNNVVNKGITGNVSFVPSIGMQGNTPVVAYSENNGFASVRKYNGSTWGLVGSQAFSTGNVTTPCLAIRYDGVPYVAYMEDYTRAVVKYYNGTSWVNAGTPGFTTGVPYYLTIKFPDASEFPWVIYQDDQGATYKTSVKFFNGTGWVSAGPAGFSTGNIYYPDIAFDAGGTTYATYTDLALNQRAVVKTYNGTNWVDLGGTTISTDSVAYTSIQTIFATPYVAYIDYTSGKKVTVKKYDGANWVNVGTAGFTPNAARWLKFLIVANVPYIAYEDIYGKTGVMTFNGTSWVSIGGINVSPYDAHYPTIGVDGGGMPYVVYASAGGIFVKRFGTVVPVTFGKLTATRNRSVVNVQWNITQEINTDYYNIEHSLDGVHFSIIGKLQATGNNNYTYIHEQAPKSKNFYRIQAVDKDKQTAYSNIASTEGDHGFSIQAAPNPVKDRLNLYINNATTGKANITIVNMEGRIIYQQNLQLNNSFQQENINVQMLKAGAYVLRLQQADKTITTSFIKQ